MPAISRPQLPGKRGGVLSERFNIDDELPLETWLPIVDTCIKQGWKEHPHLALTNENTFGAVATHHSRNLLPRQLWKAAVILFANASEGVILNLKGHRRLPRPSLSR